eukprot:scaffold1471_cov413-Prasinococcus_capsulatus_cf.AAC.27
MASPGRRWRSARMQRVEESTCSGVSALQSNALTARSEAGEPHGPPLHFVAQAPECEVDVDQGLIRVRVYGCALHAALGCVLDCPSLPPSA